MLCIIALTWCFKREKKGLSSNLLASASWFTLNSFLFACLVVTFNHFTYINIHTNAKQIAKTMGWSSNAHKCRNNLCFSKATRFPPIPNSRIKETIFISINSSVQTFSPFTSLIYSWTRNNWMTECIRR